jgi:hypothetical protein
MAPLTKMSKSCLRPNWPAIRFWRRSGPSGKPWTATSIRCGRFEARLDAHLAKVKLWTTVVIVSATVAILLGVIALCAVYGGAILAGYGSYLSALWVNSTSSLITANSWYNTASTTAEVLVNTPQARAIMVGYLAAALAAGAGWLFWLRRVDGDKEMEVLA